MTLGRVLAVLPIMGVLGAVPFVNLSPGAADVSVYPAAGTPSASPTTQISFRGVSNLLAGQITVTGSKSGVHGGQVQSHSDGNGVSFIPNTPFKTGETVTVKVTGQSLVGANGSGEVTFRTYTPVPGLKLTPNPDRGGKPKHSQHFQTEPSLLPPSIKVLKKKGPVNKEGDLFTAPKIAVGQDGAMITDPKGRLIWFHRAPKGTSIYDFRTQNLNGQPVLTWWEGRVLFAKGYGQGVIYDNTYKKVAKIKGGNGFKPDLHEFQLGSNGSAYALSFQPVMYDLSSVGGPKSAAVFDSVVQQIDIKTGLVESEWHALGHIPFTDSYVHYVRGSESPYDPFHVNSVEPESNGKLLISARNTSAVYELDPSTGAVLWKLGGKASTFKMGSGTTFIAQHDARRIANDDITIFDNGTGVPGVGGRNARGIVVHLDMGAKTATLVHALTRSHAVKSPSQGNVQTLPNGNYFVGWGGSSPYMSEFSNAGSLVFDAQFNPKDNNSYRSFRFPWTAYPHFAPRVVVRTSKSKIKLWMSWNGATEVWNWEALAGRSKDSLASVKTQRKSGFETYTSFPRSYRYVEVKARARDGSELGHTAVVAVK